LGAKITRFLWDNITSSSVCKISPSIASTLEGANDEFTTRCQFDALDLPKHSPFRNAHSLFWGIRASDEGIYHPSSFYALVNRGEIEVNSPARVEGFGTDGRSVILSNGKSLPADVLILATGYASSWSRLFDGTLFSTS
jgi:hypothetical protein